MSQLLTAAAVALVLAAALLASWSRTLGLCLVAALFVWDNMSATLPGLTLLGVSTYPTDIVFLILGLAALGRLFGRAPLRSVEAAWLGFGALVLINFARGVVLYGLKASGNDCRQLFYLFAGTAYFAAFPPTVYRLKSLATVWQTLGFFLVLLAGARWAGLLPVPRQLALGRGWMELRILYAAAGLVICQSVLLILCRGIRARSAVFLSWAVVALAAVVVLQQRSVWVAGLVGSLFVVRDRAKLPRLLFIAVTVVLLAWAAWGPAGSERSRVGPSVRLAASEPFRAESTFAWRLGQWRWHLSQYAPSAPHEWLLGKPFGRSFGPGVVSAHNGYVTVLAQFGPLGLICLLYGWLSMLWTLTVRADPLEYGTDLYAGLRVLLITQMVYSMAYSPSYEQTIFLGTGMSLCPGNQGAPSAVRRGRSENITAACVRGTCAAQSASSPRLFAAPPPR